MTDNEIVKALECCKKPVPDCDCCPFDPRDMCFGFLKEALDLINRQKAEIERLKTENEEQDQAIINALHYMKTVRTKAIKEFAERLKAEGFHHKNFGDLVQFEDIDNLVKEMTEGNSNG